MIDTAVKFLSDEVNTYLKKRARNSANFGAVIPGHIVDDTGKWVIAADNIGLTLINIEEERILQTQLPDRLYVNGSYIDVPPELKLNQIWAYMGSKYLPSVAYRVRMVVLQDIEPQDIAKPITTITANLHDK